MAEFCDMAFDPGFFLTSAGAGQTKLESESESLESENFGDFTLAACLPTTIAASPQFSTFLQSIF
jgi:hypothetical protein